MLRTSTWFLNILAFMLSVSASAGTISGTITDAATGAPIKLAEIELQEIGLKVHTDAGGHYLFTNVPSGNYTLNITHGPYVEYQFGTASVAEKGEARVSVALQPDIEPMRQPDQPGDPAMPQSYEMAWHGLHEQAVRLQDLPIRGYAHWVALQPGTVRRYYGAPIHVRGGRIEEFTYSVDGFSQQDPFTGGSFTNINANTIHDIQFKPGYRPPSEGWTSSGIAEVTTVENWTTSGSLEFITDNFHGDRSDYSLYAADLSGGLTDQGGQLSYALAGELRTIGNRKLGGTDDWNYDGTWHANLRWRPKDGTRALFGTRGSYEDWKFTPRSRFFDAVHTPRGIDENYSIFSSLEYRVTPNTLVNASLNWFSTRHRQGDALHFDDIWAYGRPNGNPRFDQTALYWAWDDMNLDPDSLAAGRYVTLHTPVTESTYTVPISDSVTVQRTFITGGDEGSVWDDYFEQKGSYIGGKVDLNWKSSMVGLELQRHTVRMYNHVFPTTIYQGKHGGFDDIDRYGYDALGNEIDDDGVNGVKHPLFIAGYANHRIRRDELTLDLGLRWDHMDYDSHRLVDPANPLDPYDRAMFADTASGLTQSERDALRAGAQELTEDELDPPESISSLSPRLGVAFSVAEGSVFHFSYGTFIQRPDLQSLYVNFDYLAYKVRTGGYFYAFGNPNLEPGKTTSLEAGWQHRVSDLLSFDMTASYKDVKNLAQISTQVAEPNSISTYRNRDFGTIKGVELSLDMRRYRGVSSSFSYTFSHADGTGSFANTQSNIAWTNAEPPKMTSPLEFDQAHRLISIIDLRNGPDAGPNFGGVQLLENAGLTALFEASSGFPYSPVEPYNEITLGAISPEPSGALNSERTPATYRLDLKANKSFSIARADLELYLWVINVFDRDNVAFVYEGTGEPDDTGWLETAEGGQFIQEYSQPHDASFLTGGQKYQLRQNDPGNFDIPRQIRFGMRVSF